MKIFARWECPQCGELHIGFTEAQNCCPPNPTYVKLIECPHCEELARLDYVKECGICDHCGIPIEAEQQAERGRDGEG